MPLLQLPLSVSTVTTLPDLIKRLQQWWTILTNAPNYNSYIISPTRSITIPANSVNFLADVEIVAEIGDATAAATVVVNFGGVQVAAYTYAGLVNPKIVFRVTLHLVFGVLQSFSAYNVTDSGGGAFANASSFTCPDLKSNIVVEITHGTISNLMAARVYNTVT